MIVKYTYYVTLLCNVYKKGILPAADSRVTPNSDWSGANIDRRQRRRRVLFFPTQKYFFSMNSYPEPLNGFYLRTCNAYLGNIFTYCKQLRCD